MDFDQQLEKMRNGQGFIAALDQSGGSTPRALAAYGVDPSDYADEKEMFDVVHAMRTRIITNPAFDGSRILGAILFEQTMDRDVDGMPSPTYLWSRKSVLPFLKIDKGLAEAANGVQVMKPNPGLDELLTRARGLGVFGTKMRSVIAAADAQGITEVVAQQFDVAKQVLGHGMIPIIEPEVDIHCPDKKECEQLLLAALQEHLDALEAELPVMFKLTLPDTPNYYRPLIEHDKTLRVVALSGGYSRAEAVQLLAQNNGMIASFSRALTESLRVSQSDEEFERSLDESIAEIYAASNT